MARGGRQVLFFTDGFIQHGSDDAGHFFGYEWFGNNFFNINFGRFLLGYFFAETGAQNNGQVRPCA